jgi:hypothetical protein
MSTCRTVVTEAGKAAPDSQDADALQFGLAGQLARTGLCAF